ncbi:AMP-binding protein, partial [Facilibium subflavum]|uniref:AMP-binding protein n=1 Tax=Facilibium subflavum TaxID=2219058 RepID=UPI0013C2E80F
VPTDSNYPDTRIRYILKDIATSLLLTQSVYLDRLNKLKSSQALEMIAVDEIDYGQESLDNLAPFSQASDLAYVIYTSGTTGQPKGVMIEHNSLVNFISNQASYYFINNLDVIALFFHYVFDASVEQIFIAITTGAKLIIFDQKSIDHLDNIKYLLQKNKVTHFHATPSYLKLLGKGLHLECIKRIVSGGEAFQDFSYLSSQHIFNEYGPAEATISSLVSQIFARKNILGQPIKNNKIYILDNFGIPVTPNTIGEIYLAGIGLSRGYLNQPELTKQRFIDNPFATDEDFEKGYTRLYKTGDLARGLSDGNIEIMGLFDFHVRLR